MRGPFFIAKAKMDRIVIYESNDTVLASLVEQALKDNGIPFSVTGKADVGLGVTSSEIKISVDQKFVEEAKKIIEQINS